MNSQLESLPILACAAAGVFLCGCATRQVQLGDCAVGNTCTTYSGLVRVDTMLTGSARRPVAMYRLRGVGVKTGDAAVIGYFDHALLEVARDCRVVVVVPQAVDVQELGSLLAQQLKEMPTCVAQMP